MIDMINMLFKPITVFLLSHLTYDLQYLDITACLKISPQLLQWLHHLRMNQLLFATFHQLKHPEKTSLVSFPFWSQRLLGGNWYIPITLKTKYLHFTTESHPFLLHFFHIKTLRANRISSNLSVSSFQNPRTYKHRIKRNRNWAFIAHYIGEPLERFADGEVPGKLVTPASISLSLLVDIGPLWLTSSINLGRFVSLWFKANLLH